MISRALVICALRESSSAKLSTRMRIGFMSGVARHQADRGPEISTGWPSRLPRETSFIRFEIRMLMFTSMFTSAVERVVSILAEGRGGTHAGASAGHVGRKSEASAHARLRANAVSRPSAPWVREELARRGRLPGRRVAPPEDQIAAGV